MKYIFFDNYRYFPANYIIFAIISYFDMILETYQIDRHISVSSLVSYHFEIETNFKKELIKFF